MTSLSGGSLSISQKTSIPSMTTSISSRDLEQEDLEVLTGMSRMLSSNSSSAPPNFWDYDRVTQQTIRQSLEPLIKRFAFHSYFICLPAKSFTSTIRAHATTQTFEKLVAGGLYTQTEGTHTNRVSFSVLLSCFFYATTAAGTAISLPCLHSYSATLSGHIKESLAPRAIDI